jgi:hypothetical protein
MRAVKLLPVLLFSCALFAQNRPQFVWQGQVDGIVILHLRDNRLDVQLQEGSPVERQRFQFHDRLPEIRQDARLEIQEGRGYAHIVDQPRLENHYSLAVAIEDRQPGSSLYSIAIYWDALSGLFEHSPGRSDRIAWSGRVDQEAVISCRDKGCFTETVNGAPVADEHFKFSRPLPNHDVEVRLEQTEGRGEIRLVEQPSERNQYTARVSIRDPQSGAGEYSFLLVWARGGKAPDLHSSTRGLTWSGTVEGRVRVTVQGGAVLSEAVAGHPVTGERADFLRPLPARSDLNPVAKRLRGHGEVQIVEHPSDKNNYRLVFEIRNPEGGADNYEIEVDW